MVAGIVFLLAFLLMSGASPFVIVDAGHVGVVKWFGAVQKTTFDPGPHFKVPFAQTVEHIDTRLGGMDAEANAASRDLQNVVAKVSVQFSLLSTDVVEMVNNLGDREKLAEAIIAKAVQESVKAVTARYNAEELITKRVEVKIGIQQAIVTYIDDTLQEKRLGGLVTVANMSITDFDFSDEFNKAIEAKVKAEQDALRAENEKKQLITQSEAQAAKVKLTADAEAYKVEREAAARASAITKEGEALRANPEIVRLRIAERWDGVLPRINSGVVPFLNLDNETLGKEPKQTAQQVQ